MKRIKLELIKEKKTPSGYWDNGKYIIYSNEFVYFTEAQLDQATISEARFKTSESYGFQNFYADGYKIRLDGITYNVNISNDIEELLK